MPTRVRSFVLRYGCAAVSIALATWARLLLDPALGNEFPFATMFFAILLTARYGGFGPALVAVVLGALSTNYFIMSPRGSFTLEDQVRVVGMVLYCGTSLGIAILAGAMHAGGLRADKALLARECLLGIVTGPRRAEVASLRQAAIVDSSDDAIIGKDLSGIITSWNKGAEKIFGYAAGEMVGTSIMQLIPADRQAEENHILGKIRSGETVEHFETLRQTKDNRTIAVSITASPIKDAKGKVIGVSKVARDISERKRAEASLRRLNADLEHGMRQLAETNQELDAKTQENEAFVYTVSHDLRSPLVNLQGFSKELGRSAEDLRVLLTQSDLPQPIRDRGLGLLDGPVAKSNRYIQTAVGRLSNIIDALLRLSRAGRVIYQRQRVEVQAIVTRVVESLKITTEERGATIQIDELPPALGDAAALEQVFANLIGNALNYLDRERPGRIEVGSVARAPEGATGDLKVYYVRDNGLGIPETGRAKVFQPFQRLHPQAAPGEGMGLAIVQRIVERHGGKIWIESTVGEGSSFFVALPACSGDTVTR